MPWNSFIEGINKVGGRERHCPNCNCNVILEKNWTKIFLDIGVTLAFFLFFFGPSALGILPLFLFFVAVVPPDRSNGVCSTCYLPARKMERRK